MIKLRSIAASVVLLCGASAGFVSETSAQDGGMCISPEAEKRVVACSSGQKAKIKARGTAPKTIFKETKREEKEASEVQTGPSIEIDTAVLRNRKEMQKKERSLLEKEIQLLKRMAKNTRKTDKRRPDTLLRLAETYFDLQQALHAEVRSFDEPIYQACSIKKDKNRCGKLKKTQKAREDRMTKVRGETVRAYAMLVNDHPHFARMDEVLFSLAYGLDELREHDRARKVYRRLIRDFPESRFIPNAYLSFAEFFFNEGDMNAARRFYGKVLDYKSGENRVYGFALYKSAWAAYNEDDYKGALENFARTIEFAEENPDAPDAKNLAKQSRKELVIPYAQIGTPGKALDFFRRYAKAEDDAYRMFENLAELYFDTGQWDSAIEVYHELMADKPSSDQLCYWQSQVTNAIISSKPKGRQVTELKRMVNIYEKYAGTGFTKEQVNQCKAKTAGILVWLATSWHREAVGAGDAPGTGNLKTMRGAEALYRMLVDKFPDMEELEFPDIQKEDWPTQYKVAYYMAELLWKMKDWGRCGPAFDRVVDLNPQGEFTSDAAYAAVLCYNNLYRQTFASNEHQTRAERDEKRRKKRRRGQKEEPVDEAAKWAPREFKPLENGMINAYKRYLCYVPETKENKDDIATMRYRQARIYYEANQLQEAAVLFKEIAKKHPDSELGEYAANFYLDSLIVMAEKWKPARVACIDDVKKSIEPLWEGYCPDAAAQDEHATLCPRITGLRCNVLRKEAEILGEAGKHKKAAEAYIGIIKNHRECTRVDETFGADEVLWNAAIHAEAAHLVGRAIRWRRLLAEKFPDSPHAKRATYLIGQNYHALAFYEKAADFYEKFAKKYPGETTCSDADRQKDICAVAPEALQNATVLRIGMGDAEGAEDDANLFNKNYGARANKRHRRAMDAAQVKFSVGTMYVREENWGKVAAHYRLFLKNFARTAPANLVIKANVLMATAYWHTDEKDIAKKYYEAAIKAWKKAPKAISKMKVDDKTKIRYMTEAVDSAAEAYFYNAEYSYAEFRKVRFPKYTGGRSLARVNKWAKKEFAKYMGDKIKALGAAKVEYEKVAALKVDIAGVQYQSAPWLIAAAARSGQMYRTIIDALQNAPVPEELEADPELFDIYVGAFEDEVSKIMQPAVGAFEYCLQTATNVRWFNEWSSTCEKELNSLDPRRFPMAAELRGSEVYEVTTLGEPGAVELKSEEDQAEAKKAKAAASETSGKTGDSSEATGDNNHAEGASK